MKDEAIEVLERCGTGVLAVSGDYDYPYAVPLNYVYHNGKIYFHCAAEGHKIDGIKRNEKVSLCVIEKDDVDSKAMNTDYVSVIVFGRARILTDADQRMKALNLIGDKYSSDFPEEVKREIENEWNSVALVEINIEHMTGKQGSDLV
jgi:nitroimidazol reductase NimA-like FMN-containing flavoprotein (pyridoxamine 5'-phosphate oxidase superfamily)